MVAVGVRRAVVPSHTAPPPLGIYHLQMLLDAHLLLFHSTAGQKAGLWPGYWLLAEVRHDVEQSPVTRQVEKISANCPAR